MRAISCTNRSMTHDHGHSHSHADGTGDDDEIKKAVIRLAVGFGILMAAVFAPVSGTVSLLLFVVAYLIAGYDIVWSALKNIKNGQLFDENFLMTIATLSAFYIREYPEAVAVMLFYQVGELFQDIAVDKSRRSIAALMDIRPDYANLKTADGTQKVSPESVKIGDIISGPSGREGAVGRQSHQRQIGCGHFRIDRRVGSAQHSGRRCCPERIHQQERGR